MPNTPDISSTPGWSFSIDEEVTTSASPHATWDKLADHEAMPTWVTTGLQGVRLEADGDAPRGTEGSLRVIKFAGWPEVTERFVAMDAPRSYSYSVIGGMPHLRGHLGTVTVSPEGEGARIRWRIDFVFSPWHPLSWMAPVFVSMFRKVVRGGLDEVARKLDARRAVE